jgi:predicted DNA-binding transcriptional regulator AlpA
MHAPGSVTGLIEYRKFLQLIVESVHPDPVDLPGLPGVLGKRRFHREIGVYTVREPLSAADQAVLRTLLEIHKDVLPQLQLVMTAEEGATFLTAYRGLSGAPPWEPALRTEHDVADFNSQRRRTRDAHDNAIKETIAQGRMRLFDVDRLPVAPSVHLLTYVPCEDAQAYLAAIALDPVAALQSTGLWLGARGPSSEKDSSPEGLPGPSGQPPKSRHRRWTEADRQQLTELVGSGQISVATVKFGISEQYARQLVTRFAKEDAIRPRARDSKGRAPAVNARPVSSLGSGAHRLIQTAASLAPPSTNTTVAPDSRGNSTGTCTPDATPQATAALSSGHSVAKVIVRMRDVEQRIGLKRSSIYARLNPKSKYYDSSFPQVVPLSGKPASKDPNKRGSAVGFFLHEIEEWLEKRRTL